MKMMLLPKFDDQTIKSLMSDVVCIRMLRDVSARAEADDRILKVLICQDGRRVACSAQHTTEATLLTKLLGRQVAVHFKDFSFKGESTMSDEIFCQAHVMFFCGFGRGRDAERVELLKAMQRSREVSARLQDRVLKGQLLYIGVCGGAMAAGAGYGEHPEQLPPGMDILRGPTVLYHFGKNPVEVGMPRTSPQVFHITSWSGLAMWFDNMELMASSFVTSKNGRSHGAKKQWVDQNSQMLCESMEALCKWIPTKWGFIRPDGWMYVSDAVVQFPDGRRHVSHAVLKFDQGRCA